MDRDRKVRLLTQALDSVPDGTLLERVVCAAPDMLGVTGIAAMAMSGVDGSGGVVAASGEMTLELSTLAFDLGEGPCRDAFGGDREVLVDDLARDGVGRWPAFAEAALGMGVAAVHVLPSRLGAIRVGGLLLHRDTPGPLSPQQLLDGRVLAELCSTLMLDHAAGIDSDGLVATGWPNRAVVHQATGMVATQLKIPLNTALARLRSHAFAEERLLDDVARDVVERRLRLEL